MLRPPNSRPIPGGDVGHTLGSMNSTQRADSLLAAYHASRAKCLHGVAGLVFMLHASTTPVAFRASLSHRASPEQIAANVWRSEFKHINALGMQDIHPGTLREAAQSEHTSHIEAACKIKASLPVARLDEFATAGLFAGRYSTQRSEDCEHNIVVAHPLRSYSEATVIRRLPRGDGSCSEMRHYAQIQMFSAGLGQITLAIGPLATVHDGSVAVVGTYGWDANGRLQDTITFNDEDWGIAYKSPGQAYDKDSSIGPIVGDYVRRRNEDAFIRWNWGLDRIDGPSPQLDDTYKHGAANGNGTTFYSLDTGMAITHDDFGGRAKPGFSSGCKTGHELLCLKDWVYQGVITAEAMARDPPCETHGTHTASTAVGTKYGVASAAEVYSVQVLDCSGEGSVFDIVEGLEWALEHYLAQTPRRPSVVGMSIGGGRSDMEAKAVTRLYEHGLLVVAAAGNDATDSCEESPAGIASVLTVGASGMVADVIVDGELVDGVPVAHDAISSYSDVGSCIDVFAPGDEILAAIPDLRDNGTLSNHYAAIMSGTSMATPIAAGVALQILQAYPDFSPDDVTRAMLCLSLHSVIEGVDVHTPNYLVQGGAQIFEPATAQLLALQQEFTPAELDAGAVPTRDATQCYRPVVEAASRMNTALRAAHGAAAAESNALLPPQVAS